MVAGWLRSYRKVVVKARRGKAFKDQRRGSMNCRRKNIQVSGKGQRLNALLSGKEVERIKRFRKERARLFLEADAKGNIARSTTGACRIPVKP